MGRLIFLIRVAHILCLLILTSTTTGCVLWEEEPEEVLIEDVFEFGREIPITTWYHFPGTPSERWAVDATDPDAVASSSISFDFSGNSTPFYSSATYYGTGFDTFEPTLGITSSGAIFFTNYNGLGDGTHIIRSTDMGQTWEDVGPFGQIDDDSGQTPNSNDPYIYVDKFTDRLVKFDMHVLASMFVEFSDDDGDSWSVPYPVEGYYVTQDHPLL